MTHFIWTQATGTGQTLACSERRAHPWRFLFPPSLWEKWKIEGYGNREDVSKSLDTEEKSRGSEVAGGAGLHASFATLWDSTKTTAWTPVLGDLTLWGWWEPSDLVFPAIPVQGGMDFKGTC